MQNFSTFAFVILVAAISGILCAEKPACNEICTREYYPLCAHRKSSQGYDMECTFPNDCSLDLRMCEANEEWVVLKRGQCKSWNEECLKLFQRPN